MLQATTALWNMLDNKGVVRTGLFAHYAGCSFANPFVIVRQLFFVVVGIAKHRHRMRNARSREIECFMITNFNRRINQNIQVRNFVGVRLSGNGWHTRRHLFPCFVGFYHHPKRDIFQRVVVHKHTGGGYVAVIGTDVTRPDGQVVGIHPVANRQVILASVHPPGIFPNFFAVDGFTGHHCRKGFNVFGVLPNQVRTGRPDGHYNVDVAVFF